MNPAALNRITKGTFNDSDVEVFLLACRGKNFGSFVQEVGDFVAHNERDRGAFMDQTAKQISQLLKLMNKNPIPAYGNAPWWLSTFLTDHVNRQPLSELTKATKLSRQQASKMVSSWFSKERPFPQTIAVPSSDVAVFHYLTTSSYIFSAEPIFTGNQVKAQVQKALTHYGVPLEQTEPVILGAAVALARSKVIAFPEITVTAELKIDQPEDESPEQKESLSPSTSMDGHVSVRSLISTVNHENKPMRISLGFCNTGISARGRFDHTLFVYKQEQRAFFLDSSRPMQMQADRQPPIYGF